MVHLLVELTELSGIYYEVMEEAGKNLDLKVNWVEEVTWATFAEGFKTNRYDIVASGFWATPARAKVVDFTIPLFYNGIGIYVRVNDNRFGSVERINREDITIVAIEGEVSAPIAEQSFPNARVIYLPQDTAVSQLLLTVTTGKADVAFAEVEIGEEFIAKNPNSLKNVVPDSPIRIFASTMVVPKDREAFKTMLNITLEELINNGTVDRIIEKYQKYPDSLYLVAPPYIAR